MKNEELHKLLGGYATNTLTESERRVLFEAALEDQELFNALHDEQALKELLTDPASREAIQRALDHPVESEPSRWWSNRWLWGGLASAAGAAVLIVAVVHQNRPAEKSEPVEIAATKEPANLALEAVPEKKKPNEKPSELPLNGRQVLKQIPLASGNAAGRAAGQLAAPAPPPPQPAASEQARVEPENKLTGALVGGAQPGISGFVANAKLDPVRYSLLKKDGQGLYSPIPTEAELRPGDSVRLNVTTAVSGYLSLYRLAPSGEWQRIYPESPQEAHVTANTGYTVPEAAIEVQNNAQKFRISITIDEAAERDTTARQQAARAAAVQPTKDTVPLTLDLAIAPGKIP